MPNELPTNENTSKKDKQPTPAQDFTKLLSILTPILGDFSSAIKTFGAVNRLVQGFFGNKPKEKEEKEKSATNSAIPGLIDLNNSIKELNSGITRLNAVFKTPDSPKSTQEPGANNISSISPPTTNVTNNATNTTISSLTNPKTPEAPKASSIDGVIKDLTSGIKSLSDSLKVQNANSVKSPPPPSGSPGASKSPKSPGAPEGGAEEGGASVLGTLGAVVGPAVAAFAALPGVVADIAKATEGFVAQLAPGLIENFTNALHDLQATIGVAFTGIFEKGIDFFEKIAGLILPLMQELKPVIDQLANDAIRNAISMIKAFIPVVQALIPIVQRFFEVVSAINSLIGPLLEAFGVILAGTIDALMDFLNGIAQALFGVDLAEGTKKLDELFKNLAVTLVTLIGKILLLIGANETFKKLLEHFDPKPTGSGESRAGATSISSLEQIGKDLALSAVKAAGGVTEDTPDETNKKIYDELVKIREGAPINAKNIVDGIVAKLPGGQTTISVIDSYKAAQDWRDRQNAKPGVFGYTSLNPF